ncbi:MAG TPA: hypothetical protein VKR58_07810 [Aquella sp.]|nr:hypothetical protein [Aquella sp.]
MKIDKILTAQYHIYAVVLSTLLYMNVAMADEQGGCEINNLKLKAPVTVKWGLITKDAETLQFAIVINQSGSVPTTFPETIKNVDMTQKLISSSSHADVHTKTFEDDKRGIKLVLYTTHTIHYNLLLNYDLGEFIYTDPKGGVDSWLIRNKDYFNLTHVTDSEYLFPDNATEYTFYGDTTYMRKKHTYIDVNCLVQ